MLQYGKVSIGCDSKQTHLDPPHRPHRRTFITKKLTFFLKIQKKILKRFRPKTIFQFLNFINFGKVRHRLSIGRKQGSQSWSETIGNHLFLRRFNVYYFLKTHEFCCSSRQFFLQKLLSQKKTKIPQRKLGKNFKKSCFYTKKNIGFEGIPLTIHT